MDYQSSFFIVLMIVSVIAIVTILVALLYKPGKRLKVDARYLQDEGEEHERFVEFHIVNIGKKRVKMATPFVLFYTLKNSMLFEIKGKYTNCKFPKIIPVGEEMRCKFDLGHYEPVLQKREFEPHHIKIVIRDTIGMRFKSNHLDY